jgi:hypothetical protein
LKLQSQTQTKLESWNCKAKRKINWKVGIAKLNANETGKLELQSQTQTKLESWNRKAKRK